MEFTTAGFVRAWGGFGVMALGRDSLNRFGCQCGIASFGISQLNLKPTSDAVRV